MSELSGRQNGADAGGAAGECRAAPACDERADAPDRPAHTPIAILGQACRLPGAADPEAYWRMLIEGRSAIRPMAGARWDAGRFLHPDPRRRGRSYTDAAGLIEGMFDFDAGFFGLSAREAEQMDPQQRLLLMVAWEALEDAGLTDEVRCGRRVGTYVGCSASDHAHGFVEDPALIDAGFMTGNTLSIVANRLSHLFDLQGPSFTVDTACSSSLVALDLAVRALGRGEIDFAVVAGVHALLSPLPFIGFSRAGMLSPTGRLRAFDAEADGYVRGEGAVVLVLGRADAALRAGDRPHAEILATAVNTTGRGRGLTNPSADRQAALMQEALARAATEPAAIAFVEAHGTGTPVGDPEEAAAIGRTLGTMRAAPLPIGSVKPNIGHLEPVSGLAGLLKTSLALGHGCLPPSIGCDRPSSAIDWTGLNIRVATEPTVLPAAGRRVALVNSFGFGGANAAAVLRAAPPPPAASQPEARALVLSAASEAALSRLVADWRARLETDPARAAARINAAVHRRSRLAHTAVAVLADGRDPAEALDPDRPPLVGRHPGGRRDTVFAFCGNGANHAEMGAGLLASDPVYRDAHAHVCDLFREIDPDLDPRTPCGPTDDATAAVRAQPALFALQVALVEALAARGLRPGATIGHSVGEVAAVWAAGGLALGDAVRLIATRAPLLTGLGRSGGMLALLCSAERAERAISDAAIPELTLSGDNSPRSTTVSGPDKALARFERFARAERIACRRLPVAHAFHSPVLEPLRTPFLDALDDLDHRAAEIPFAASTTGGLCATDTLDLAFWWRNLRDPVRFREAAEALGADGYSLFLEIGPRPILQRYIHDSLAEAGRPVSVMTSLDARGADPAAADIVARCVAAGSRVDLGRFAGPKCDAVPDLPAYPWDLRGYAAGAAGQPPAPSHPILGSRIGETWCWEALIDTDLLPWLADHRVEGRTVLPAAALAELLRAAGAELGPSAAELTGLDIVAPMTLGPGEARRLRTRYESAAGVVHVESRAAGGDATWTLHARGRLRPAAGTGPAMGAPATGTHRDRSETAPDAIYAALRLDGIDHGPSFRRIAEHRHTGPHGRTAIAPPTSNDPVAARITALDAAIQALQPMIRTALPDEALAGDLLLPARIERLRYHAEAGPAVEGRLDLLRATPGTVLANLSLIDETGAAALTVEGLRLDRVGRKGRSEPVLLAEEWVPLDPCGQTVPSEDADRATGGSPESDADLIIDALCRRAVRDTRAAHGPAIEHAARDADAPCHGLACLLAEIEVATDAESDDPTEAELIDALIAVAPEEAARLRRAMALPDALARCLASGEAQTMPGLRRSDPAESRLDAMTRETALGIVRGWRGGRLRVLVLGDEASGLAEALRHEAGLAALEAPLGSDPLPDGPFDLVIGAGEPPVPPDAAASLLGAGGRMLWPDQDPTLLGRLTRALTSPGGNAAPTRPPGLRRIARIGPDDAHRALCHYARPSAPASVGSEPDGLDLAALEAALGSPGIRMAKLGGELAVPVLAIRAAADPADQLAPAIEALRDALGGRPSRLVLLCVSTEPADADCLAAGLGGAMRSAANEHPDCDLQLICAPPPPWCDDIGRGLARAIVVPGDEREIALTSGGRTAPRLRRIAQPPAAAAMPALSLDLGRRGDLGTLSWRQARRADPGPHEIEIEVAAAALNFRDVMWTSGLLPEEALAAGHVGTGLGMEIAGTVLRAGSEAGFAPGDRVAAIARHGFASHATVDAAAAFALPPDLALSAAAGLPVAFLTAAYALRHVARVGRGERVLIHGGAGGVGLAAMQVAKAAGARVLATAGTSDKRRLLATLGAEAVFDSRTLGFAEEVRHATDGLGVDVVLNSLSGEAMRRSLDCLAPFGRFVELGKRDFLEDSQIGLRAMRANISYHAVDADALLQRRADTARALIAEIGAGVAAGTLSPLPIQRFDGHAVADAMKAMKSAAHIGKIVISPPQPPAPRPRASFGTGAWLIVGGLGGIGIETAGWLAARGVRRIWLTGRSGRPRAEGVARLAALRAAGVAIETAAVDATDAGAMAALVAQIARHGPVEGVIHSAMVLADSPLLDTDRAATERVLAAKLEGARVLDRITRAHAPDRFVLFGSLASAIGNPGQASYAAANAALGALARQRRAEGLPATVIGWGPVGDAGHLARDTAMRERLSGALGGLLQSRELFEALDGVLSDAEMPAVVHYGAMPWGRLSETLPTVRSPLFGLVCPQSGSARDLVASGRTDLSDLDDKAALALLREELIAALAQVLRQGRGEIDPHRPLLDLGLDSLMSVDLRLALEERLGRDLPPIAVDVQMTLSDLARDLLPGLRAEPRDRSATGDRDLDALVRAHRDDEETEMPADMVERILATTEGGMRS